MLEVKNISKSFDKFQLSNISFQLPKGYIMGFIGSNGAGKTTTLKAMLNLIKPDSGEVFILGQSYYANESQLKQDIGISFGAFEYYQKTSIKKLYNIYKRFYHNWDDQAWNNYLNRFSLDITKKVSDLSTGMRVKLGLAFALSHKAKLFIFDEPTTGLDPFARDELLDIFRNIIEDGEHSVLFSTHITSDLDKCADYIVFINDGKVLLNDSKDNIIDMHVLVSGKAEVLDDIKGQLIGYKKNAFGFTGLGLRSDFAKNDKVKCAVPNLEELMILYGREA